MAFLPQIDLLDRFDAYGAGSKSIAKCNAGLRFCD